MAQHKEELYLPFRRYHIGKVFRGENTQRGRYREFTQCDFDIVGPDSVSADFDILLVMVRSLEALGIEAFHVSLAHRGVFNTFLDTLELQEQSVEILRTVDKLRKLGPEKTRETLAELTDSASADRILDYITPAGDTQATLAKLESLVGSEAEPLRRLKQLLRSAEEAGIGHRVQLDPSITRGLDYYTGTVFETFLDGQEHIGSVCSGGRYNDLASLYTKQELPGVGSSIGLDRLIAALDEQRSEEAQRGSVSVLILCVDEELVGYYHTLAEAFRKAGFSAEVYPEKKKLATQFGFAEKKGIPLGVIAGGDERARNVINLRDLRRRESYEDLSLEDAVARAGELL
jgi:histidyl-tRNA synthetase